MLYNTAIALLLAGSALASPVSLDARQSGGCPNIHVFGARETTAPAGYGSAGTFVNLILNAHPGATAELSCCWQHQRGLRFLRASWYPGCDEPDQQLC